MAVQNVTVVADCTREYTMEELVEKYGALRELNSPSAKYCFQGTFGDADREVIVMVYPSGKLVCMGANDVDVAVGYTRRVLERIGSGGDIQVKLVVMTGMMSIHGSMYNRIGDLREKFLIHYDTEVMAGMMELVDRELGARIQLFPGHGAVNIVANGPDESAVRRSVEKVHSIATKKIPAEFKGDNLSGRRATV